LQTISINSPKLNERLLVSYMERFVGFGALDAGLWFVGMEQGGGQDLHELARRLEAWQSLGSTEVADLQAYCELLGERRWHGPHARIQPTLGKMVRVVLATRGENASPAAVRAYQSERLGRAGGETLVAELFPLPSQTVGHWIYGDCSSLPYLRSRQAYLTEVGPKREALLRAGIDLYAPRAVVFLGWCYMADWRRLIETPLELRDQPRIGIGRRGKTVCIVSLHPTSYGVTNEYFSEIGKIL
jgi:hypothetical protein